MPVEVLLLDIEGTTTPISFVYDVLFPFARTNVRGFLEQNFDDAAVEADRRDLAAQASKDVAEGVAGAALVDPDSIAALVANVHWQMDSDRKTTALKSLQGKIWRAGYADGDLRGVVFDDVPPVLRAASDAGVRTCIYSSGSIAAQKLLFANSTAGDLSGLLAGYFDTTTGPKKVAASYTAIAGALGVTPASVIFCTDNLAEAQAAKSAGMRAVMLDRPGNHAVEPHTFETWQTLTPAREHF